MEQLTLDHIEAQAGAVLAQGGKVVNGLNAADVLELVRAYKIAQQVRRQGLYAEKLNDHEGIRNALNQLPTGGDGPLWVDSKTTVRVGDCAAWEE